MKTLILLLFCIYSSAAFAQVTAPAATSVPNAPGAPPQTPAVPQAPQAQTESLELAPVAGLAHPDWFAVTFLPLVKGNESVAFVVSPSGKIGTIPLHDIAQAYKTGYRPFTVADLLAIANAVADEEKNLQRRTKELSEDYDALAARYNRLAVVNSATPVQPQPAFDERQAMRAMVFRSLLQRTFPAPPLQVQVQTVDCTKFPALCVDH